MKQWRQIVYGILIGLLSSGILLLIAQPDQGSSIVLSPAPTPTLTVPPKPTVTETPVTVQISGEIKKPGAYTLQRNLRLNDLILAAGGTTNKADLNRINLVLLIHDGDYFYIPAIGEPIPETARNAPGNLYLGDNITFDYPLNINDASQEALESLPGIGPTKASEIILYRETFGAFSSVDDLLNVPGIGSTILESIREYVIIGP